MLLSPHLHVSRSVNYSPCMHKTELWIVLAYIIHFAICLLSLADSNILILHYYTSDICLLIWKLFLSALNFVLIFKCTGLNGSKCVYYNLGLVFSYHSTLVMSCVSEEGMVSHEDLDFCLWGHEPEENGTGKMKDRNLKSGRQSQSLGATLMRPDSKLAGICRRICGSFLIRPFMFISTLVAEFSISLVSI